MNISEQAEQGAQKGVTTALSNWWENIKGSFTSNSVLDNLKAEHATKVAELTGRITALDGAATAKDAEITTLKADHATALAAKDAEIAAAKATAAQQLARVGHQPVVVESIADKPEGAGAAYKEFQGLLAAGKSKEASEFYAKNQKDIFEGR